MRSHSNETRLGFEPRTSGSKYPFDLFWDTDKIFTGKKGAGPTRNLDHKSFKVLATTWVPVE